LRLEIRPSRSPERFAAEALLISKIPFLTPIKRSKSEASQGDEA